LTFSRAAGVLVAVVGLAVLVRPDFLALLARG
jgi:hypothetical protein